MQKLGEDATAFKHVVFPEPDDRVPALTAKMLGIPRNNLAPVMSSTLGDLGSCSAFISLAGILDSANPGDRILLASYGSGSSNAMSLVVRDQIGPKRKRIVPLAKYINGRQPVTYTSYLRLKEHLVRAPY